MKTAHYSEQILYFFGKAPLQTVKYKHADEQRDYSCNTDYSHAVQRGYPAIHHQVAEDDDELGYRIEQVNRKGTFDGAHGVKDGREEEKHHGYHIPDLVHIPEVHVQRCQEQAYAVNKGKIDNKDQREQKQGKGQTTFNHEEEGYYDDKLQK